MNEVYEFLKACKFFFIATLEGRQPRVRPFGTIDLFDGKLYIQTGRKKEVAKQLFTNPKIEICAFNGRQWLRVAATAVLDTNPAAEQHMFTVYPGLKGAYAPNDGNNAVLYLKDATATFHSFSGDPVTVEF